MPLFKDAPNALASRVRMYDVNQKILIHEGPVELALKEKKVKCHGTISYVWFPFPRAVFEGAVTDPSQWDTKLSQSMFSAHLLISGSTFGKCRLIKISHKSTGEVELFATFPSAPIKGDKSISVKSIEFCIPNLRSFRGTFIKREHKFGSDRLTVENDEYTIILDKTELHEELFEQLKSAGGFINLYDGEIVKKSGSPIHYSESSSILRSFAVFLSFINGRRTSPLFRKGIFNGEIVWEEYGSHLVDSYKACGHCLSGRSSEALGVLWKEFSRLWKDEDDRDFLTSLIHWYVESNGHAGFTEGSIMIAQTALELIYNWLLIEKHKLIAGNDSENLSASNKIRLILSHLNVSTDFPANFTELAKLKSREIFDAPEAFVQIRNAIVHSQENKRKKLRLISDEAKVQALHLAIWYIELSMLKILTYTGEYMNRTALHPQAEEVVPWIAKS